MQTRRRRCAQHGDGAVDIAVRFTARTRLPAVMPSTGCAQEILLAWEVVHNGRKLSTLGISRTTLHAQSSAARLGTAPASAPRAHRCTNGLHLYGPRLGSPRSAQQGSAGGPTAARRGPWGMRAFAGRALARFSSIRACVRRTGDSSAASAGLSMSLLPARPAQIMRRPGGRLPLLARTALLRREPRARPERHTKPARRARPDGTTMTSPGWLRSGKWSPMPIPNSRSACPATYPLPNNRLRATPAPADRAP